MGEVLDDVRRTLDFIIDLDPFAAILMIWVDDEEALDKTLAAERRAFRQQIRDLLTQMEKQFPRWIIPPLGTHFDPRLFSLLRRRGMHGPLWQHIHRVTGDDQSQRPKRTFS